MKILEYLNRVQHTEQMTDKDIDRLLTTMFDLVDNFHAPVKQLYELNSLDTYILKGSDVLVDMNGSYYKDSQGKRRKIGAPIVREVAKALIKLISKSKDARQLKQATFYESNTIGVVAHKLVQLKKKNAKSEN